MSRLAPAALGRLTGSLNDSSENSDRLLWVYAVE